MKTSLITAILLSLFMAINSQGLLSSILQLCAFLLVILLVLSCRKPTTHHSNSNHPHP